MADRSDGILVRHEGEISTITFNRPERLNALDPATLLEFMDVTHEEDLEPETNAIVLTGAGRAFTAGGDIKSFGSAPDHRVNRRGWHLVYRMLEVEKPVVAMVNGPAMGFGLTIALLSDLIIAADDAVLGDPHVELGAVAGDGVAIVLPLLIGPHRAKELLLLGRAVSGADAAEWGMIHKSVPGAELAGAVDSLVDELRVGATVALGLTKHCINGALNGSLTEAMEREGMAIELSSRSADFREGLSAFQDRRDPTFEGH